MTTSIKPYIPFEIVYWEEFEVREEAIKREKYFKSSAGRRYLRRKLNTLKYNACPNDVQSGGDSMGVSGTSDIGSPPGHAIRTGIPSGATNR